METTRCTDARAELTAARAALDARRARDLVPLEEQMLRTRATYKACFTTGKSCVEDYEHLNALKRSQDAAEARYLSTQQKMLELESDLFPLVQQVDRSCGRQ